MATLREQINQAIEQGSLVEVTRVDRDCFVYGLSANDGGGQEEFLSFAMLLPDVQQVLLGGSNGCTYRFPTLGGAKFELLHIYKHAYRVAKAVAPAPAKPKRVLHDNCPKCGDAGEWRSMALVCRAGHGIFAG